MADSLKKRTAQNHENFHYILQTCVMTTVQTHQWVGGIEKSFKFDMTGNRSFEKQSFTRTSSDLQNV